MEPLEEIANRILRITVNTNQAMDSGAGPVLSVVRDTASRKIYVGFNTGVPRNLTDAMYKAILAHQGRIWSGELIVVRTAPEAAAGGHSEINALNRAIQAREALLNRRLTEADFRVFELHNVWLRGDRAGTTAARCEHCAGISRGVTVTQSLFVAEGGVTGQVTVPQRGSVTPAGSRDARPVTTASGTIGGSAKIPVAGAIAGGLLTGAALLAAPAIKRWFAENYLQVKWAAEERAMVEEALELSLWRYNALILTNRKKIQAEKAAGRAVVLSVEVDTEFVHTDMGPAQTKAEVSYYTVLYEGETTIEWPVFQPKRSKAGEMAGAPRRSRRRTTYVFPL